MNSRLSSLCVYPPGGAWGRGCGLILLFTWLAAALSAAQPAKKAFDLPAAPAEEALRAFAQQTAVELVFNVEHVHGVRTKAVKGRFTLREALARLLAGSPLVVVEDAQTGAFFISRGNPAAQKTKRPPDLPADRARPATGERDVSAAVEGEAIVLSPFRVESARQRGYAAESTLAGTRLNTALRDLGASVSVYPRDLLADLGATSPNDLMIYATGMEAAGPGGNFSNGANDINDPQVVGEGVRNSPQTQWRTRGLAAPNATRGFFVSDFAGDAYNTESITVSRGPNATLFGVGSPAGVVDTTLIQPDLRADAHRVEVRYGDNDSLRRVVDLNRVIIPRILGFRLAALDDEERFDQRPAYERKRRIFGAATFAPWSATVVRANFETGHTRANRPFQVMPFRSFTADWEAAGRPVWDWSFYDDPARNPDAAAIQSNVAFNGAPARFHIGQAQIFGGLVAPFERASSREPALGFRSTTPMGNMPNSVRVALPDPRTNRDAAFDTIAFYETFNQAETPTAYYPDNLRPAGVKFQGFTDFDAFDFRRNQIDETGRQDDSFHTLTVSLEQRGWNDQAGIELAYYTQRYDNRNRNSFFGTQGNANHVRIDPNVTLPDGRPNPHVGRPYAVMSQQQYRSSFTERQTLRATTFLRQDFRKRGGEAGGWLGRHTLTGLGESARIDTLNYFTTLRTTGAAAEAIAANPLSFNRLPNLLVYLGDSILDGDPLRLEPIRTTAIQPGLIVPTGYFAAPPGTPATTQAEYVIVPTTLKEIFTGGSVQRERVDSFAVVLQSHWFNDLVVTTLGWRRDEDYIVRSSLAYDPERPEQTARGLGDFSLPAQLPLSAAKEVRTVSAVVHWPGWLQGLPRGVTASGFYNRSENFTPLGTRVNYFNELLRAPEGRTREFGLNLGLVDDRVGLRYTRFETGVQGASYFVPFNYQNAIVQMTGAWHAERNLNPTLDRTADVETLFAALPADFRDVYQFQYTGSVEGGNLGRTVVGLNDVTDTTDYRARGHELELSLHAVRGLRLLANVAYQSTVQFNIAPFTQALVARLRPAWDSLAAVPRFNYPAGWVEGSALPNTTETVGDFVQATVYVPHAVMVASQGSAAAEQRNWRANAAAYYDFQDAGRLRGWSVGAGLRWQSRVGIGYPASYRSDGSALIDLAHPYYGPATFNVDLAVGYTRRWWRDRLGWRIQLNVRNALGDRDAIPVTAQPDGTTASARIPPERRWYLTNTFSF